MTYSSHLKLVILATLKADPRLSYARISDAAHQVGRNWVADFMTRGSGTLDKAAAVAAACNRLCPVGPEGDELRWLLQRLDFTKDGDSPHGVEKPDELADSADPSSDDVGRAA